MNLAFVKRNHRIAFIRSAGTDESMKFFTLILPPMNDEAYADNFFLSIHKQIHFL